MKKAIYILGLVFSVFCCQNTIGQWVQTSLNNGWINCLDTIGMNIFAGTEAGIFLSTDYGENWSARNNGLVNNLDKNICSFAIADKNIFIGTSEGVFLSTDNGGSWNAVNNGLIINENCIFSLVICGTNIFAGTEFHGIFLSTNNGKNWSQDDSGLTNLWVNFFATNCIDIFAGTGGGGIFLTTNDGENWNAVNKGLPDSVGVISLAIKNENIFAGTIDKGMFLSTDNGTNWKAINNGLPDNSAIYSLVISDEYIIIGTYFNGITGGGVYLSTNNGGSWNAINNGLPKNTSINALCISNGYVYAGTLGVGVWKRSLSDLQGVNEVKGQNSKIKIEVYPNPAKSYIEISCSLVRNDKPVMELYDITGRIIRNYELGIRNNEGQYIININTEDLQSGIYFVRVENQFVKFIKL